MNAKFARKLIVAWAIALSGVAGAATGTVAEHVHPRAAQSDVRWQGDEALRQGMLHIRASVEESLPRIRAGQFNDEQYVALGKAVETQLAYIVKNCRLEPAADAALHDILGELSSGIDLVRARTAEGQRTRGVSHLVAALDNYGRLFDHAGWMPIKVVP